MSRVQLALNVDNVDEAVWFYSKLFNTAPAKLEDGYANFVVADPPLKLVLIENPGEGGTLNHLGVEVDSSDAVHAETARLAEEGMVTEEQIGTICCFATQDKVWVTRPGGEKWEIYIVLADSETFGHTNDEAADQQQPRSQRVAAWASPGWSPGTVVLRRAMGGFYARSTARSSSAPGGAGCLRL